MNEYIINWGNPLKWCPINWEEAREIEEKFNKNKEEWNEPIWSFDCWFKLDFDWPIMSVNSRFYPPKTHYWETWDWDVTICILWEERISKHFDCKTIEELKNSVYIFIRDIELNILNNIKNFTYTDSDK